MSEPAAILVAARDEEETIAATVAALKEQFPDAEVIVADDGSRDRTAVEAERAGARVVRLPQARQGRGPGARRARGSAAALSCFATPTFAATCVRSSSPRRTSPSPRSPSGRAAASGSPNGPDGLSCVRCPGTSPESLCRGSDPSRPRARERCFPPAPGFGCEVRMTIDAVRAGLRVTEVELPLAHRATGRDARGFAHRGRQLFDAVLACGPLGVNHRGPAPPARRLARRRPARPGGRRRRGDRPRRRSLVGPRARLPAPPELGPDDGRPQARRHSARRPARDAQGLGRAPRRPRRQLPEPARHAPRSRAQGLPRRRRSARRTAPEPPSCYFHTIFARRRCLEIQGRTRWARC